MKREDKIRKSGRLASAVGNIGDDLVAEAERAVPAPAMSPKTAASARLKRFAVIAAAAALLAALAAGGFLISRLSKPAIPDVDPASLSLNGSAFYSGGVSETPAALRGLSVTAEGTGARLMPATGSFLVKTAAPTDAETLSQYLKLTPEAPVYVKASSDTEFVISPASGSFAPGTVYRLTVGDPANPDASFAFQTASELVIKSLLPADRTLNVPADAGIEITFSESVKSVSDVSAHVSFSPSIKGTWDLYPDGRTAVFVPSKQLEYDSVYSYTVSGGVESLSGKKLAESSKVSFRTAAEKTGDGRYYLSISLEDDFASLKKCVSPRNAASVNFTLSGRSDVSASVKIRAVLYKYPTVRAAFDAVKKHEANLGEANAAAYTLSGLEKVWQDEKTLSAGQKRTGYFYISSHSASHSPFVLPAGLAEGAYLLTLDADYGGKLKAETAGIIQVTSLRCFSAGSDGITLLMLSDDSGNPVSGSTVTGFSYTPYDGWNLDAASFNPFEMVSSDGFARISTGSDTAVLALAETAGSSLIVCRGTAAKAEADYFMKYLYTDREVYFQNDIINIWGFAVPLYGAAMPGTLFLQTGLSPIKTPVAVGDDGTFSASVALEQTKPGGLYVKLTDANGSVVAYKYVRVTSQDKPVYTASLSFDKLFYKYGDRPEITLTASFFDGTPAEGLEFCFRCCEDFELSDDYGVTGPDGRLTAFLDLSRTSVSSTEPLYLTVEATLSGFETQTLRVSQTVLYFHSDYVFSADSAYGNDFCELRLNRRDLSSVRSESDLQYPAYPANTVGEPAGGKITYRLIKYVITSTPKTVYDTYTKRSFTSYSYTRSESTVSSGTAEFKNGVIELPKYAVTGFTGGYFYDISYKDGRTANVSVQLSATKQSSGFIPYGTQTDGPYIYASAESYVPGDRVNAQLKLPEGMNCCCFWVLCADGIVSYSRGPVFSGDYTDGMVPGAALYACFYDPSSDTFSSLRKDLPYDWQSRASLDISAVPGAGSYRPGQSASVSFKVKDSGGRPVPGVRILVSIADEACFALGNQSADIPAGFFESTGPAASAAYQYRYLYLHGIKPVVINEPRYVISPLNGWDADYTRKYLQEAPAEAENSAAEMYSDKGMYGDNVSYYVRDYFADNPVFAVVTTGSDGSAELSFTVPDNITSWRITACAFTGAANPGDILCGSAVSGTVCTQPFFLNCGVCGRYIHGDDVAFSVRAYGTESSGSVSYKAVLYDASGKMITHKTAKSDSKTHAWFNFGTLEEGEYTVMFYGDLGSNSDALKACFSVVGSLASATVNREMTPDGIKTISPLAYPVSLSFYTESGRYSLYNRICSALMYLPDVRTDAAAARYVSLSASSKIYGTDASGDLDLLKKQFPQNGIVPLIHYGTPDPALTAELLSVCPELFGQEARNNALQTYLGILSSAEYTDGTELCSALLGLSVLGEPVLDRLYAVAAKAADFPAEAKLYLAAAFAAIGDYAPASGIWNGLRTELGVEDGDYGTLYVRGTTLEERVRLSSLALLSAARINKADASKLALYLCENATAAESPALALASYLRFFAPSDEDLSDKKLVYILNGERKTAEVGRGKIFRITLTRSEFASFSVVSAEDGILAGVSYTGSAEDAFGELKESGRIRLSKTVTETGSGRFTVSLRIRGTSTRISESFSLHDWIPSGARFVSVKETPAVLDNGIVSSAYIYNSAGQNMNGYIRVWNENEAYNLKKSDNPLKTITKLYENVCPEYSFDITVKYEIRGAVAGRFICESAVVESASAGIRSTSERQYLTITDKRKG